MKKHLGLMLKTMLLSSLLVSMAWAEEQKADSSEVEIEKTVVTATRTETPIGNLPVSVTVISKEEIEKIPAKTVDDVLNKAAGVQIRRNQGLNNTGSHTTIYMRGTGDSSRVLVLKDGIPLNLAYGGTVNIWNTISLQDIEKIEIVRGAASALYGSSAMGGVINIITKRPDKKVSGSVSVEGGMLDTYIGSARISNATNRYSLRALAEHKTTGGYEYYKGDDWKDYYKKSENELTNLTLGGDVWLGNSLLRLDYEHLIEDSMSATTTQYDGEQKNHDFMLSWGVPIGKMDLSLKSYYFDSKSESEARSYNSSTGRFDTFYYDSSIPKQEYGVLLQISGEIARHRLTVGSDFKWASCDSEYTYRTGDRNFSGKQDFYSFFETSD